MNRPQRSASESLLSITLGMEAFVVFFATITIAGLGLLPAVAAWTGGLGLMVVFLLATRLVRRPWGVWFGWGLQLLLIATGFIHPLMFVIGLGFAGLWIFCFITGRRLDRQNGLRTARPDPATAPDSVTAPDSATTKESTE